jgi:hypothetical protein
MADVLARRPCINFGLGICVVEFKRWSLHPVAMGHMSYLKMSHSSLYVHPWFGLSISQKLSRNSWSGPGNSAALRLVCRIPPSKESKLTKTDSVVIVDVLNRSAKLRTVDPDIL